MITEMIKKGKEVNAEIVEGYIMLLYQGLSLSIKLWDRKQSRMKNLQGQVLFETAIKKNLITGTMALFPFFQRAASSKKNNFLRVRFEGTATLCIKLRRKMRFLSLKITSIIRNFIFFSLIRIPKGIPYKCPSQGSQDTHL